jgi:hypothetical protein
METQGSALGGKINPTPININSTNIKIQDTVDDKLIDWKTAPISTRFLSFTKSLELLHEVKKDKKVIVEVGCINNKEMQIPHGNSSELFAWYAQKYPQTFFYSVDLNPNAVGYCSKVIQPYNTNHNIFPMCEDGLKFTQKFKQKIDYMYFDAVDYDPGQKEESAFFHMQLFYMAQDKFTDDAIILIDDNLDLNTFEGKGKLLIPHLLKSGDWFCHWKGYQFLFQRISHSKRDTYQQKMFAKQYRG